MDARRALREGRARTWYPTNWLEPPWKPLLSNKALLAIRWELFEGHELLLPAYLDGPLAWRFVKVRASSPTTVPGLFPTT
jgi:hypothetical protein